MGRASKKDQILAAAEELFLEKGFDGVSMDDIAGRAPVSKPTLYAHFRHKADLFLAVFQARCADFLSQIREEIDVTEPPEKALPRVGALYLERIYRPEALNMLRVVIAAGAAFPGIGANFFEAGPRRMEKLLADYLAAQHRRKTLRVPDPAAAAEMFMGLLKGNRHMRALLGMKPGSGKKELKKSVAYAAAIFLAAHGAKGPVL